MWLTPHPRDFQPEGETVSQKKRANFETVYLKIVTIDFDGIWQKYSKYSRIEFVRFGFRVGLLFINFLSFKPDTFIRKLYYKLPSDVTFTFVQTFDQNFTFFTEWSHVDRQCEA